MDGGQDDDDNDSEWESCSSSENDEDLKNLESDEESWEDCGSDSDSLGDDLDKKSNGQPEKPKQKERIYCLPE